MIYDKLFAKFVRTAKFAKFEDNLLEEKFSGSETGALHRNVMLQGVS